MRRVLFQNIYLRLCASLGRYTSLFANLHLLRANFEYGIAVPALLAVENLFIAFSYGFRAQNICANEFSRAQEGTILFRLSEALS